MSAELRTGINVDVAPIQAPSIDTWSQTEREELEALLGDLSAGGGTVAVGISGSEVALAVKRAPEWSIDHAVLDARYFKGKPGNEHKWSILVARGDPVEFLRMNYPHLRIIDPLTTTGPSLRSA